MLKSIIVAKSSNHVIGVSATNRIPWHLPADLRHFKSKTLGHYIIMGRRTFESLPNGLLLNRHHIVLTQDPGYKPCGVIIAFSLEQAFEIAKAAQETEVFIIGGSQVYQQALHLVDKIYLTQIHALIKGDVYFPILDPSQWQEIQRQDHVADDENIYPYSFIEIIKKY